jgi:diguanylate cyclase (GGDEF)-like protein
MDQRLQRPRMLTFGILAVVLVAMGPWVGWWTLIPLGLALAIFLGANRVIAVSTRRPEYAVFASWVCSQLIIAVSVALAWDEQTPVMSWFAIPIITLSARFSLRGVVMGVLFTLFLMTGIAFVFEPQATLDYPPLLVMPMAVVLCAGVLSTALMHSDQQHRDEAIIDPLTSMLNRKALSNRVGELRAQASISGAPIGVVLVDIDHFKGINDTYGHSMGDAVLRDIAYTLRKNLRAFELAYRIGGEEFLLLLPGADIEKTQRIAEEARARVEEGDYIKDETVTISAGVSATTRGEAFDYPELYRQADERLYEAKHAGRNRVAGPAAPSLAVVG